MDVCNQDWRLITITVHRALKELDPRANGLAIDSIIASNYYRAVIRVFACQETKKIFQGTVSLKLPLDIQTTARRKLTYLDSANSLTDLHAPRGNRLEALKGKRKGQYSIRINDQWRICFEWRSGDATKVEIVDYH